MSRDTLPLDLRSISAPLTCLIASPGAITCCIYEYFGATLVHYASNLSTMTSFITVPIAAISAYCTYLSITSARNVKTYEPKAEQAASISKTADKELQQTRETETYGVLAVRCHHQPLALPIFKLNRTRIANAQTTHSPSHPSSPP